MSHQDQDGSKGGKRARTRRALLQAARELLAERGYEATTLDAVAQRAGMTTGAIYGNFKNRNELFVTLGQVYWSPIQPKVHDGASLSQVMRALADATLATLPDRTAVAPGRLSGMAHTLRDQELGAQVAAVTEAHFALGAQWLQAVIAPDDLPMPADQLVRVIHALSEGLVFQRILTPELVPDSVFYAAFDALARAAPPADLGVRG